MALNLETGRPVWTKQVLPGDAWIGGCVFNPAEREDNCPDELGPDFDFGNSPILQTLPSGRDIIVIGQKSGVGWALDPDNEGDVLWSHRVGQGTIDGGEALWFGRRRAARLLPQQRLPARCGRCRGTGGGAIGDGRACVVHAPTVNDAW